jgi:hypothetical protein
MSKGVSDGMTVKVAGMPDQEKFCEAIFEENGELDFEAATTKTKSTDSECRK